MPPLTRYGVRAAVIWLLLGSAAGGLLLGGNALEMDVPVGLLLGVHVEAMLFGWMLQVTVCVAWWILPRRPEARGTWWGGEDGRGPRVPALACVLVLNTGVLLGAVGRLVQAWPLLLVARAGALLALAALMVLLAPRVRAFGAGAVRERA